MEFIADAAIRELYQQIARQVRPGQLMWFTLRCDGPACRRLLEMTISAEPGGPEGAAEV